MMASPYETLTLAKTLWGEARGEPEEGKLAVALVILNRAREALDYWKRNKRPHPLYDNGTIAGACLQPWQFSCWNKNDPNMPKLQKLTADDFLANSINRECLFIALAAIDGRMPIPEFKATHYYSTKMKTPPSWAKDKKPVAIIGNHAFFDNID